MAVFFPPAPEDFPALPESRVSGSLPYMGGPPLLGSEPFLKLSQTKAKPLASLSKPFSTFIVKRDETLYFVKAALPLRNLNCEPNAKNSNLKGRSSVVPLTVRQQTDSLFYI